MNEESVIARMETILTYLKTAKSRYVQGDTVKGVTNLSDGIFYLEDLIKRYKNKDSVPDFNIEELFD